MSQDSVAGAQLGRPLGLTWSLTWFHHLVAKWASRGGSTWKREGWDLSPSPPTWFSPAGKLNLSLGSSGLPKQQAFPEEEAEDSRLSQHLNSKPKDQICSLFYGRADPRPSPDSGAEDRNAAQGTSETSAQQSRWLMSTC